MPKKEPLALPMFFDPASAYQVLYQGPNVEELQQQAFAFAQEHALTPASQDRFRVHLLVIDAQVDFSFPEGALHVAGTSGTGAQDANLALVTLIYRNLAHISEITCTLDTHNPYQIFFPAAHLDQDGQHPKAHTIISATDYEKGRFVPNPGLAQMLGVTQAWLQKQFVSYCQKLEENGKHQLYLWPYHCLQASPGHQLTGVVQQARLFHAFARASNNPLVQKGQHPLSEAYSVFCEEVTTGFDNQPIAGVLFNTALVDSLLAADRVIICGLASSHCVKESVGDLMREIQKRDPLLAGKIYLPRDCTAAVVVPGGPDFSLEAEKAYQEFEALGVHLVDSTTPVYAWEGFWEA